MFPRQPFDVDSYIRDIQQRPCFICEMVAGNPQYQHEIIYQDNHLIAFLNKFPTLYGYVLVAPCTHKEQVTSDFTLEEYLALQTFLYRLTEAVRQLVNPERVYLLSLGSQQGNRHVHWHIAPLPSGVPFEKQQCAAISLENGILALPPEEMAFLANRLRQVLMKA